MRRIAAPLALGLAVLASACGQYTNFPARVHVSGADSNLVGEVTYTTDSTGVKVTVKSPKLVVIGEAGSVGVQFDHMQVQYQNVPDTFQTKNLNVLCGLHVDSSHMFSTGTTPTGGGTATTPTTPTNPTVVLGKGSMDLPVVTPDVIKAGQSLLSPISAAVTLTGTDDAMWPADLTFGVTINFIHN